jgi:hypothetical protein
VIRWEYSHMRPAPLHSLLRQPVAWRHDSPVYADGDQIEDGGGTACDVHGYVEVTYETGESPSPVHLQQKRKPSICIGAKSKK